MKKVEFRALTGSSTPCPASAAKSGVVYLVGGGPGDPGLLTIRGAELLSTADVILHDELVDRSLLDLARSDAELRHVGKRGGNPPERQASQTAIEAELISHAKSRRSVVRLKGGDPFLFGRGSEEAEALAKAGVPFEVVPGIPSPLGATAYAGISVTHRDFASSVTFVSGTGRDGAPFDFSELSSVRGTVCVLMGMRRIDEICAGLIRDARRDPATPTAAIQWGTRATQVVVEGRLDSIAQLTRAARVGSPAIIVVGQVASLRGTLRWFDARPLFGKRVLVTRPEGQAAATSDLLRRRGAVPVEFAMIALVPPPDTARVARAARELDRYDVVAFTSENGVAWLFRELDAQRLDARAFGTARIAAVGSATAAALRTRGLIADIVPAVFLGDALAKAIVGDAEVSSRLARGGARALVPRALAAREVLPERLRAAGFEVDIVPVYETRSASADRRDEIVGRLVSRTLDVVMFTSSSTVTNLCDLLGSRAAELLAGVLLASIGPVTTATAQERGLTVGVTAAESTTAGLVAAIEQHLAQASATAAGPTGATERLP